MPLSDNRSPEIVTIPVSGTNIGDYTFNLDLPTSPLNSGASEFQILWIQFVYTADATVGTRNPVMDLLDESLNSVFSVASINTQTANQGIQHSLLQGVVIFPVSVFGLMRTIPVNGLYGFNNYTVRIQDLSAISAGDTFAGFMQVRLF